MPSPSGMPSTTAATASASWRQTTIQRGVARREADGAQDAGVVAAFAQREREHRDQVAERRAASSAATPG